MIHMIHTICVRGRHNMLASSLHRRHEPMQKSNIGSCNKDATDCRALRWNYCPRVVGRSQSTAIFTNL